MNPELTYNERKEWARLLYTRNDYSASHVALTVHADEETVQGWIEEGSWIEVRRSALTSKATQLNSLYQMIEKLCDQASELQDVKSLDQLVKLTAAVKNLETEESVSNIIAVAELFIDWLRPRDAELAKAITSEFESFISERSAA